MRDTDDSRVPKVVLVINARYSIYSSAVLDAPIEVAWKEVRDLSRMIELAFPGAVSDLRWTGGSSVEQIPSILEFTLQPSGAVIREEVVGRSEIDYTLRYRSVGATLSMIDYIASFRLRLITDEMNKSFLETTKEFSLVEGTDASAFLTMYEALVHKETRDVKAAFAARARAAS